MSSLYVFDSFRSIRPCAGSLLAQKLDTKTALESYRASMPAFTRTGIPTDAEINEHLASDAQALKLAEPVHPSKIFDFSLQSDVLAIGIK